MSCKLLSLTASETRKRFSWCLNHMRHTDRRIEIFRHGKPIAALVNTLDLSRLEAAERKSAKQKEYEMLATMEAYRRMEGGWGEV